MTLPSERTRSVIYARMFLTRLSSSRGIKGIPKAVREEALAILRHYPFWFDLGRKDSWDEKEAMRIAEEQDDLV
jgi:hypothetical protein